MGLQCWTNFNHCNLEDGIVPVLSHSWDLKSQGSLGDFCDISGSAGATVTGNSFLLSKWTSSQSMVAALSHGTFACLKLPGRRTQYKTSLEQPSD